MGRRISLRMLAVSASMATIIAMSATSAHAIGDGGKLNMWQNDAYQGQHESRSSYDDNLHNDACSGCDPGPGGTFGDDMSSYVNNTDYWWAFYEDKYREGTKFCVRPRSKDGNLGNNGYWNLEDHISSARKGSKGKFSDRWPTDSYGFQNEPCDAIIGHKI